MNKFRLTRGVNSCDGSDIFYVYSWETNRWALKHGFSREEDARKCLTRLMQPTPEIVLEEVVQTVDEGPIA